MMNSVGVLLVFLLDLLGTLFGIFSASPASFASTTLPVLLFLGRSIGLSFLSLLAVRVSLGRWPSRPRATEEAREVSAETAPRDRQAPLLGSEHGAQSAENTPASTDSVDGNERARQIDETVRVQEDMLKKLERGIVWRNCLLSISYIYMACCCIRTAALVVRMDTSSEWNVLVVVLQVLLLPLMQAEFIFLKRIVLDLTSGEPVHMPAIHEHPLYWTNVEGKGYTVCSTCNEKVGTKTGGYTCLQSRAVAPGQYGFGGFQICMNCYRKNAAKSSSSGNASGAGILRSDSGPQHHEALTVTQYIRRLSSLVSPRTLVIVLCCVGGSQSLNAYIPKAQGNCINALVKFSNDEFDQLVLWFAILVVCNALLSSAMAIAIQTLQVRLYNDMAVRLFGALISQDIAFYDNAMTGQMNSRLNNDLRQAVSPVSIIMNSFVANIVMLTVGFGICLQSSWKLTVLAFTFLTPVVHISAEFSKWASRLLASQYTYLADAQGSATQALTNIRTVRTFGARDLELEKYRGHMRNSQDVGLRSAWGQGGANLLSTLVQQGASFVILFYGGHLALDGDFEIGSIITFTYLWNKLSSSFTALNENINQPVKAMSAGQRVFEILDLKPDILEETGSGFPGDDVHVSLQLSNLTFTYQGRPDTKVLNDVTIRLDAGKTTAIVGKSGCGKSTLSKLLLRFYNPQGGSITLNDTDLKDMHLLEYRRKIGVVSQDTQLFRVSVLENITYGLPAGSYSMEDVERAARLANADEFIKSLPEGYKTMVGEGGHDISGGQKQRLSIARALVRRPRLLLLDEATSALDAENEALVQEALDSLMQQMQGTCTIMVIAHRLSTIKDADKIVVLHESKKVEEGTHEELLRIEDGRYATMIARQLEGGKDIDEDSDTKNHKQVESEILRLLNSLPEDKRGEVMKAVMMSFKGAGKGMKR